MISLLKPGVLASVQDQGRPGHRRLGICPGGALDQLALALANRLVGNADGAAGIELTLGACELRFERATRIALTGDDFDARLDGRPLWPGWSVPVEAGQTLVLGGRNAGHETHKAGVRSWLAVAGGIEVPVLLGSRSTDLKAGFGGFQGRALKRGDRLPVGVSPLSEAQRAQRAFGVHPPAWAQSDDGAIVLRVLPGPEYELFTAASRELLWGEAWRVTSQSNRMGSRLEGPELKRRRQGDMLSSGVVPGTVQVPPSGQPIILMGDAQTTGGYPRIGVVIRADLWQLAQAPIDGRLRLVQADPAEARAAWDSQQRYLEAVSQGLQARGWPRPAAVSVRSAADSEADFVAAAEAGDPTQATKE